jgi:hypothetical protein
MFFTREGLEQASGELVARHRARRYLTTGEIVHDICCSIGGDALGMATNGIGIIGVDLDPLRLAMAHINMMAYDVGERVTLRLEDAQNFPVPREALIFFDPARRRASRSGSKRRVFQPDEYQPPLSLVEQWLGHVAGIGVKVAPGIDYDTLPYECEVEVVSVDGDVKEACLWFGALQLRRRSATLLRSGNTSMATLVYTEVPPVSVTTPQHYMYEPDGAVIRAHLVEQLAAEIDAVKIDEQIALLTNDRLVETPFARAFEVYDVMPFNLKRLRAHLRELQVGRVVVKKRGSPIDPQVLEQQLRLAANAPNELTLMLTHVQGQPSVVLCNPVKH